MQQYIDKPSNKRLYLLVCTAVLGVAGLWSWLFESRLQGMLLELVDQYFDVYYPDLTGIAATLILVIVPLYLALRTPAKHEYELRYEDLVKRLKARIVLLALAVLVFFGLSAAAYQLYGNAPTANQEMIDVDLSAELPNFIWLKKVSLNGVPMPKHATFSKDLRRESSIMLRRYTPIVDKKNRNQAVRFVESFTSNSTQVLKERRASLQGFVSPRLLPAAIRSAFEADGLIMANTVYVIEDRFFDIKPYLKWSSIFLLTLALLLLIRLILSPRIHKRKLQDSWDYQKGYSKNKNVADDIAPWG